MKQEREVFKAGDVVCLKPGKKTGLAENLMIGTPYTVMEANITYAQCILLEGSGQWYSSERFTLWTEPAATNTDLPAIKADTSAIPDSGARSEFDTGAVRDAMEGKGTPSLIPLDALRAVSRRFEDGAAKYAVRNWEKGIPLSRFVDSLYRHLWAFMEGDQEEDHGGAIIWNAMCLHQTSEWIEQGKLPRSLDDLSDSRSFGGSND